MFKIKKLPKTTKKPHLEQAHLYWKHLLNPSDIAIDATCGNGKDTLYLAKLLPQGHVYTIDIQTAALEKARASVISTNITFLHQCHTQLPSKPVKLVVYNLGYLPGGNKLITTMASTTIRSIEKAATLLVPGGALSVTCYPGHTEGALELAALFHWIEKIDHKKWEITYSQWRPLSPTIFFILKIKN